MSDGDGKLSSLLEGSVPDVEDNWDSEDTLLVGSEPDDRPVDHDPLEKPDLPHLERLLLDRISRDLWQDIIGQRKQASVSPDFESGALKTSPDDRPSTANSTANSTSSVPPTKPSLAPISTPASSKVGSRLPDHGVQQQLGQQSKQVGTELGIFSSKSKASEQEQAPTDPALVSSTSKTPSQEQLA